MQIVLFVCHAGASSQFLVQRLSAQMSNDNVELRAASFESLPDATAHLVVVGPPLVSRIEEIRGLAPNQTVCRLSEDAYADHSGSLAAAQIRNELANTLHPVHQPKGVSSHG